MKKNILRLGCVLVLLAMGLSLLTACDSSLEVIRMEITSLPDRTEYPVGYTGELDLQGGMVEKFCHVEGLSEKVPMTDCGDVLADIDFTVPGTYEVELRLSNGVSVTFPVRVVEKP